MTGPLVRRASADQIEDILSILDHARSFMAAQGNPGQWAGGYPDRKTILGDIAQGNSYVIEEGGVVHACFSLIEGEDPTYAFIYEGSWKDHSPYATVHRLASDGKMAHVSEICFAYAKKRYPHLRADTHEKNGIMRRNLLQQGLRYRGKILTHDGTERLAYEYSRPVLPEGVFLPARLFVAVLPDESARQRLAGVLAQLQEACPSCRAVDPSNLHITLAFIGSSAEYAAIADSLLEAPFLPLDIRLCGYGRFPGILYASVEESGRLAELAKAVRHRLDAHGIRYDAKPFAAHMTLARKVPSGTKLPAFPAIPLRVGAVSLMRSAREGGALRYTQIFSSSAVKTV